MAGRLGKLKLVEQKYVRQDIADFDIGDTVKMKVKVQEADKVRLHSWEGIVISRRGTGIKSTFTVRKITFGEGVEKTFPLHSPTIASLKVVSKGKVNRAKLFYLRDKTGKGARVESELAPEVPDVAPAAEAQAKAE
ncbi:MAG: 50S ribosomal protein L19 [Candidatus Omnitrophica bacterium]|nr:50S ribosomal protein L19 [Candidatus Omnitrophota bacterium]